ncbi:hypothetical protein [Streptomyces roseolus]|uniref:hypothetical protein n=1 Tax=Streptomyces roseolus TaxID=67358 RepID=UPI00366A340A
MTVLQQHDRSNGHDLADHIVYPGRIEETLAIGVCTSPRHRSCRRRTRDPTGRPPETPTEYR